MLKCLMYKELGVRRTKILIYKLTLFYSVTQGLTQIRLRAPGSDLKGVIYKHFLMVVIENISAKKQRKERKSQRRKTKDKGEKENST